MVSASAGWAIAGDAIYHTADGARTWRDVTPAVVPVRDGEPFFLGNSAWLFSSAQCSVYYTADGGATWKHSAPVISAPPTSLRGLLCTGPAQITFADANHGLLGFGPEAMMTSIVSLYATTDGGASWQLINNDPHVEWFYTVDSQLIMGVTQLPQGGSELWQSRDGGHTWELAPIQYPATALAVQRPVSFDGGGLWSGVTVIAVDNGKSLWLQRSTSGGTHWALEGTPLALSGNGVLDACLVSETVAFVVGAAGTLSATTDGGATWNAVATHPSAMENISFPSSTMGWALDPNGTLLTTSDGGHAWMTVPYTIAANANASSP